MPKSDNSQKRPGDSSLDKLAQQWSRQFDAQLSDVTHPLRTAILKSQKDAMAPLQATLRKISEDAARQSLAPINKMVQDSAREILAKYPPFRITLPQLPTVRLHPPSLLSPIRLPVFDQPRNFLELFLTKQQEHWPPNWGEDLDLDTVGQILTENGIPLVWVPRAEVVNQLAAANDYATRTAILMDNLNLVIDDCQEVLGQVDDDTLSGQVTLAHRSLTALRAGFFEPAQSLAVNVTETVIAREISGHYGTVSARVEFDIRTAEFSRLRVWAALAPIAIFYTKWYPNSGKPVPFGLSRHTTVHQADTFSYTEERAIVAALLCTSVLKAFDEARKVGLDITPVAPPAQPATRRRRRGRRTP